MPQPDATKIHPPPGSPHDDGSISPLQGLLTKAWDYLRAGENADALDVINEVRITQGGNIYLDTMATHIALLVSMTRTRTLSEEQRTRILETFPSLIECATADAEEPPTPPAHPEPVAATTESPDQSVAVVNQVNDYLARVDHWVHQGEYQKAHAEIHRIFEIDPNNAMAEALEQEIVRKVRNESAALKQPARQPAVEVESKAEENQPAEILPEVVRVPHPTVKPAPIQRPRLATPPVLSSRRRPTILIGTLATAAIGLGVLILVQAKGVPSPKAAVPAADNRATRTVATTAKQPVAQTPSKEEPEETTPVPFPEMTPVEQAAKAASPQAVAQDKEKPKITKTAVEQPRRRVENRAVERDQPSAVLSTSVKKEEEKPVVTSQQKPALLASNEPAPPPPSTAKPFVAVQREPQVLRLERPVIPDHVFSTSSSVQILVRVQIGTDGKPLQAKIVRSTNALADQAVIDAVMKSEYAPGVMSAGPVKTWVHIPFTITK